jgi:hypothetical protein
MGPTYRHLPGAPPPAGPALADNGRGKVICHAPADRCMKRLLWASVLVLAMLSFSGCMEASGSARSGSDSCLLFCGGSSQEASFEVDFGPFFVMLLIFFAVVALIIVIAVAAAGRTRNNQQQQQQVVVQVQRDDDAMRRP